MRFTTKRSLIATMLTVLAVWPLVHRVLIPWLDVSPWKGFGWAMYCAPERDLVIRVTTSPNDQGLLDEANLDGSSPLTRAYNVAFRRRQVLGRWAPPDALARAIFAGQPKLSRIEIAIEEHKLDRKTARIVINGTTHFEYERADFPSL